MDGDRGKGFGPCFTEAVGPAGDASKFAQPYQRPCRHVRVATRNGGGHHTAQGSRTQFGDRSAAMGAGRQVSVWQSRDEYRRTRGGNRQRDALRKVFAKTLL